MKTLQYYMVAILLIVTLAACAPKVDANQAFVENLKTIIGTTNPDEIPAIAHKYTDTEEYASWMLNVELGDFVNTRGEKVVVKTVNGEPQYSLEKEREETKWVEPVGEVWQTLCVGQTGNENHIMVYASGNAGTIGRLKANEETIQQFACQYFFHSIAPANVLHLNFHSTSVPIQLLDVGDFGAIMPLQPFDWDTTSSLTSNLRNQNGEVVRAEVILQLNNLQGSAEQIGFTTNQMVTMALANELVGWLSGQQADTQLHNHNEAYSTIAGLASSFDASTATLFLGSNYESFVQIIADEMKILTGIANR